MVNAYKIMEKEERTTTRWIPRLLVWLLIALGTAEALHGFGQLMGLWPSGHSLYRMTGSFYNPGPYMGYLALSLPLCLHEWMRPAQGVARWRQRAAMAAAALILCLLPAGMSRAAWAAATAAAGYVLWMHHRKRILRGMRRHRRRTAVCLAAGVLVLAAAAAGAYLMKKDSADGRRLMWKVAAQAVCRRPWTGCGWHRVAGAYGDAQEAYFAAGRGTPAEERVAGSPEYVFNEYLQVAMAWGVPALVLLLCAVTACLCLVHRRQEYGLAGAWVALMTFAFASYPLQFALFTASAGLLAVASVGCACPAGGRGRGTACTAVLLAATVAVILLPYREWRRQEEGRKAEEGCRMLYRAGAYGQAVACFAAHHADRRHDARFLFEYGHALHRMDRPEESDRVLREAMEVSGDPMILNVMAKNCRRMGRYDEAERWLLRSVHRLPGRIYPYYLLARLYGETGAFPRRKLEWAVRRVTETEPKVHSTAVREMREQVRRMMEGLK